MTDGEDREARSTTRIGRFLSFWTTFPGVLTIGGLLLVGITVFVAVHATR
jgi:hypothetical protein